jgi:DNA modification methylase
MDERLTVLCGDALEKLRELPDGCVQTCITSPPYFGLRSYLSKDHPDKARELGTDQTPEAYVARLVGVFREVRRVLKDDGTLWLNLGDSYASGEVGRHDARSERAKEFGCVQMEGPREYAKLKTGLPSKNLLGIPWRVAFALQADDWILRSDVIWHKPNCMPESVRDRPTRSHEYLFLLSKSPRYYYDYRAVMEPGGSCNGGRQRAAKAGTFKYAEAAKGYKEQVVRGGGRKGLAKSIFKETRNRRTVWSVPTKPYRAAHFAVFPEALITPCILAGSRPGDLVLDPFAGSGTTLKVAIDHGRRGIGIELNHDYIPLIYERTNVTPPLDLNAKVAA